MSDYVEFKGLKHYPLGNANLELDNEKLIISGIGSSGFDGTLIELPNVSDWVVKYEPIEITNGKILNLCYRGIDGLGRLKTIND